MASLYLTNMGSYWSGGTSINSISMGDDGRIFLAGATSKNDSAAPIIKAYKDGVLIWQSGIFSSSVTASFNSVFYKDGYIYAAGGIKEGFSNSDLQIDGFIQSKGENISEPDNNYYGFFSKFDASTGELIYTKVLESDLAGNSSLSVIKVDDEGNIYTSGTNIAGDNAVTKFNSDGSQVFQIGGGSHLLALSDDGKFTTLTGSESLTSYDASGGITNQINGWIRSLYEDPDSVLTFPNPKIQYYLHGSLLDDEGNIYFAYTKDIRSQDWAAKEPGTYSTVLMKVRQSDGSVIWSKTLDSDGFSEASSLVFDPNGNLLVSGYTVYDLHDQESLGGYDAFLSVLDAATGDILSTKIIGSAGDELATQAMFDIDQNLYLSGTFSSKFYDLKDSGFQNIYLISDDGFTLMGDDQSNEIQSGNGDDSISGGNGNDSLNGGGGDDSLDGGVGNDTLYAGSGDDTVMGGAGHDLIIGGDGAGNDTYNGGSGIDTIKYTSAKSGITVNLSASTNQAKSTLTGNSAGIGVDQLSGIENIIGSSYADKLTGDAASNSIAAGSGNDVIDGGMGAMFDVIDGGAGADTVSFASLRSTSTMGVTLNLALVQTSGSAKGYTLASGLSGTDWIKGIENIIGSSYADKLAGDATTNRIAAGSGNDVIDGGTGAAVDVIDGGAGTDTVSFASLRSSSTMGVTLNLAVVQTGGSAKGYALASGLSGADWIKGIENITGSSYDDNLTGDSAANTLKGGLGNDVLTGGGGKDCFDFTSALSTLTNVDTITDFTIGSDKIRLDNSIMNKLQTTAGMLSKASYWEGAGITKGHDADDRILYDTASGKLYYDADGSGSIAAVQIALIGTSSHANLDYTDFFVI